MYDIIEIAKGNKKPPCDLLKHYKETNMSIEQKCSMKNCNGLGRLDKNGKRYMNLGYCMKHYERLKKYGSADYLVNPIESHGMHDTKEYRSWVSMKTRCYNSNHQEYFRYGDKGVTVCDRWRQSFSNFYKDMGDKPSPRHTLDRINPEKGYEPGNCRWATPYEQTMNRRKNKNNKSGYVGVSGSPYGWRAYGMYDGKSLSFGTYDTPEEAAYIRDQFMMQLHGDSLRTNFDY